MKSDVFQDPALLEFIIDRINVGVFIVDASMEILLWNRFMQVHSNRTNEDVLGKNLFDCFSELPKKWFEKKINSVFVLENFSFTSWEQRPYIFKFTHNRPVTGGVDWMYQNLALMPIKGDSGKTEKVCIVVHDVTDIGVAQVKLHQVLGQLEVASRVDGLTGLYNRAYWEETLANEFSRSGRYGSTLSLIMFDLDHFKVVNDTYGHLTGDAILKSVATTTQELIRESDVPGRYGGEEFGIILPATDIEGATQVGQKLCREIEASLVEFEGANIAFTASVGVAEINDKMSSHEDLISQADAALYFSKSKGRNCVNSFPIMKGQNPPSASSPPH